MRIEYAKPMDGGVQQLQYVGDTDGTVIIDVAPIAAALIALFAKKRSTKLVAAVAAVVLGARALR
jgi:hypothetical protein